MQVQPNEFGDALKDVLATYSVEIQEKFIEAAQKIANSGATELKASSPKRTGKYAKGWTVSTVQYSNDVVIVVHNKVYRLTHLLEHGHKTNAKIPGKKTFVDAKMHIEPVEQKVIDEFHEAVKKIIGGAG